MTGTRWTCVVVFAFVAGSAHGAKPPPARSPKSAAQVRRLTDTLKTDGDEKRRRAAVADLREADPRLHPDIIPALVGALQRDPSAAVRADAAEAVGQFKVVSPAAGAALEAAAEADPVGGVRDAAQQALWEYHLSGYRSSKGADGIAGQTAEPPLAAKPLPRPSVVWVPEAMPAAPAVPTATAVPVPKSAPVPAPPAGTAAPRVIVTAAPPLQLNVTEEPPLAKKPAPIKR